MDDAEKAWIDQVQERLLRSEGRIIALEYILAEAVRALAASSANPRQTISRLFDLTAGRLDQTPLEKQGSQLHAQVRTSIEDLYSKAGTGL